MPSFETPYAFNLHDRLLRLADGVNGEVVEVSSHYVMFLADTLDARLGIEPPIEVAQFDRAYILADRYIEPEDDLLPEDWVDALDATEQEMLREYWDVELDRPQDRCDRLSEDARVRCYKLVKHAGDHDFALMPVLFVPDPAGSALAELVPTPLPLFEGWL